jgi:hypothetical protein
MDQINVAHSFISRKIVERLNEIVYYTEKRRKKLTKLPRKKPVDVEFLEMQAACDGFGLS